MWSRAATRALQSLRKSTTASEQANVEAAVGGVRPLTAEEVHNVGFSKPTRGRGYDEEEVDAFLDVVEGTLNGTGVLTAAHIHNVAFKKPRFGKRGYDEDEVDAFLDIVEAHFARHEES